MPHEKIHRTVPVYGQVPVPVTGTGTAVVTSSMVQWGEVGERVESVTIAWYPDRSEVQLGIDLGKPFVFAEDVASAPGEEIANYTSLHMDLSRHEINRMIKALRRARDAAYGRDE